MSDNELKVCLKSIVFDLSKDEHESPEDGFRIGTLSNEDLYGEVVALITYYKDKSNGR
jgi:hypothetical protein